MKTHFHIGIGRFILFGIRPHYHRNEFDVWHWHYDCDQYNKCLDITIYFLFFGFYFSIYWDATEIKPKEIE